jgi:hypothetical protein
MVSVVPMQLAGVGEMTNVAVATGTQGFASLSLQQGGLEVFVLSPLTLVSNLRRTLIES